MVSEIEIVCEDAKKKYRDEKTPYTFTEARKRAIK